MKTLDILEKVIGTLYILVALIPLPFAGTVLFAILSSVGVASVGQYYYFYLFPVSIFFFVISLILTKKVDLGQLKTGRRIRRFFYFALVIIPVVILIMKVVYPQGNFHIGL